MYYTSFNFQLEEYTKLQQSSINYHSICKDGFHAKCLKKDAEKALKMCKKP